MKDMWRKLKSFVARGRKGWAPEDTWSLDCYLERVLAETLAHLAATTHSVPTAFPGGFEGWTAALRRWSAAFAASTDAKFGADDAATAAIAARQAAFEEMLPWWDGLWD